MRHALTEPPPNPGRFTYFTAASTLVWRVDLLAECESPAPMINLMSSMSTCVLRLDRSSVAVRDVLLGFLGEARAESCPVRHLPVGMCCSK
jgi:hypothetical protein